MVVPSVGALGLVVVSLRINSLTEVVRILGVWVLVDGLICSGHSIGEIEIKCRSVISRKLN